MKLTTLLTTSILPLAGLIGTTTANAVCWRLHTDLSYEWKVSFAPVPKEEIGHICHKFWRGLRQFPQCIVYHPSCGQWTNSTYEGTTHGLQAHLVTTMLCNGGMMEAAVWEATHNKYGSVNCA